MGNDLPANGGGFRRRQLEIGAGIRRTLMHS
jgi:hypothetical protein